MRQYFCEYCGYTAGETEFLEGECPACCTDLFTGEVNKRSIPKVFHTPNIKEKKNGDDSE